MLAYFCRQPASGPEWAGRISTNDADQDAVAFGTWAMAARGLDNIEREQWRYVWPCIRGFTFEAEPEVGTDGDTA